MITETPPHRAWFFRLEVNADTRPEAVALLKHFVARIEGGSDAPAVITNPTVGGTIESHVNAEMTREEYFAAVIDYLKRNDA